VDCGLSKREARALLITAMIEADEKAKPQSLYKQIYRALVPYEQYMPLEDDPQTE
jgi:hypothetical protein